MPKNTLIKSRKEFAFRNEMKRINNAISQSNNSKHLKTVDFR